ncbi:MAG: hypothetical protein J5527_13860 [Treponema sp.]|nr:hypothetical protein [Treponema sp.]
MSKFKNIFAIKTKPCYKLSECLEAYSKAQLQFLIDSMNLDEPIASNIKKAELVSFMSNKIMERLDYLFRYLESYDFIVTAAYSKDEDADKGRLLEIFMQTYGEGAEDIITFSNMNAFENGLMYLFAEDEENPVLVVPDEVKAKIQELVKLAKEDKFTPGDLHDFMEYGEVLSALYGLCPTDVFMQIYERDYPDIKINKKDLKLYFKRAAFISGGFVFDNNMLVDFAVNKSFRDYILKDRNHFKPYIPSEDEIFEHIGFSDYDEENPAFKKLVAFLGKELKDIDYAEDVAYDIIPLIKVRYTLQEIVDYVQNEYGILTSEKSFKAFCAIYQDLNNTSHLWSNWGHLPETLRDEYGDYDKTAFSEEFLQKKKEERENRPHIELPKGCLVPSDEEIARIRAEFDEYWGNYKTEPAWHKDGERIMRRIMKEIKANINVLSQMPESSMNMLFDQWIASVYHTNANRAGAFGDRTWDFYTFDIAEKLRDNLFTCLLPDGSPIVVASPSLNTLFDEDNICCLTVLVDMGGWFIAYGPQLGWKGLQARDIEALARSVAGQTFELKGLNGVIHFNPVPFWCAQKIATVPPIYHNGSRVIQCFAETRFAETSLSEDFPPEWARKKGNEWVHEVSQKGSSKTERWIFNKDDYLGSAAVYYDGKTGTVQLYSCNEEMFDKAFEEFGRFFDKKHCEVEKVSMSLATMIKNNKKQKLLERFEKGF